MGEPRRAWEQIRKSLPFAPHQQGISHSPFEMPNFYVANAELNPTGQNMNDWQTGSSNVLLETLVRDVFGFRPRLDQLVIAPASWSPFQRMTLHCQPRGCRLKIEIAGQCVDKTAFRLSGGRLAVGEDVLCNFRNCSRPVIDYGQLAADRENRLVIS